MLNERFKFGIEIEFNGVRPHQVETHMRELGIHDVRAESYNHMTRRHWKVVTDATVSGGELVSPILCGEAGLVELHNILTALNEIPEISVNRRCGLHVHVSWDGMTVDQIKNIANRYAKYEDEIDLLMPRSRRGALAGHGYCKTIKDVDWNHYASRSGDCVQTLGRWAPRDHKLNVHALNRHGTIEFRHHSGTTDFEKISNWVRFCIAFVEASVNYNETTESVQLRAPGSRAYTALRANVESAGGTMVFRGGQRWTVTGSNNIPVDYSIEELNEMHVGSLHGHDAPTPWQQWRKRDWTLRGDAIVTFMQRHFPGTNIEDHAFIGVDQTVADYYDARKIALNS